MSRLTVLDRRGSRLLCRIDNDGNYEPGNVRWVTAAVNANNRSNTRSEADIVGKVSGNLTVVGLAGRDSSGRLMVTCKCTCGTVKDVLETNLRTTKSCGCSRKKSKP